MASQEAKCQIGIQRPPSRVFSADLRGGISGGKRLRLGEYANIVHLEDCLMSLMISNLANNTPG